MPLRYQLGEYLVPINGKLHKIREDWLRELELVDKKKYNMYDDYIKHVQLNPLAFFLPHGRPRRIGGNDGLALLNDVTNDLILLTAPNQVGKSYLAAAYIALRAFPTDKDWLCFKEHGVRYHEYRGPSDVIIASYSWDEVDTVWNTYRKILPREVLGPYAPFWGHFRGEHGKPRQFRFHNTTKRITFDCGTKFTFLSYIQSLTHWEGKQCDKAHLDEQCPEDKFDALTARQITRGGDGGFTPIIMSLTGHVIPDRPDTGAAGWIKRKIVDADQTKGRKVGKYRISIADVPDVIISESRKKSLHHQWVVEPKIMRDEKKKREAEARYHGGWEIGSGIVFTEWNPDYHVIEPFDIFKYKPTLYRMIDHGQNPCAAGLFAVMPWGDGILFQEYYEYGRNIYNNARAIVEMCGNRIEIDEDAGWEGCPPTYHEVFCGMEFRSSEMDARSFGRNTEESGKSIGQLYNENGCWCTKACAKHNNVRRVNPDNVTDGVIPLLKDHLAIRRDLIHIDYRLGRPRDPALKEMGAPKLYVFSTCKNFRAEVEKWTGLAKDDVDDMISVAKFFTARERPYFGDYGLVDIKTEPVVNYNSSITGY